MAVIRRSVQAAICLVPLETEGDDARAEEQDQGTEDAAFVTLQEFKAKPPHPRHRQPGEDHHPDNSRKGQHGAEHDKPDPAIADAGQVDGQETLAGRERQKCEQAENDGPVRFDASRLALFGNRCCHRLNRSGMLMLLEIDLVIVGVIAMRKGDARREFVRFGNLVERFEISVSGGEGECLPGAIGPQRLDRQGGGARQRRCPIGPYPELGRDAGLEDLQHQYAVPRVDPLRLGSVVMTAMTVAIMILGAAIGTCMIMAMRAVILVAVASAEMAVAVPAAARLPDQIIEPE